MPVESAERPAVINIYFPEDSPARQQSYSLKETLEITRLAAPSHHERKHGEHGEFWEADNRKVKTPTRDSTMNTSNTWSRSSTAS